MTKFIVFKMHYVSPSFVRILRDSMHHFASFAIRGQSVFMKYFKQVGYTILEVLFVYRLYSLPLIKTLKVF